MHLERLPLDFYTRDVLDVAPGLIGKKLVRRYADGRLSRYTISETEAYRGFEDKACHASKGKTPRTEVMFEQGGVLYMYLIYGMYWMLNVVSGHADIPQAVLIRALAEVSGPGRLAKELSLDKSFNKENLLVSERIWIEDSELRPAYHSLPRVGIDYAGDYWKSRPWRFLMK